MGWLSRPDSESTYATQRRILKEITGLGGEWILAPAWWSARFGIDPETAAAGAEKLAAVLVVSPRHPVADSHLRVVSQFSIFAGAFFARCVTASARMFSNPSHSSAKNISAVEAPNPYANTRYMNPSLSHSQKPGTTRGKGYPTAIGPQIL